MEESKIIENTTLTVNTIAEDPEIYTLDNFITDEVCSHFINISKDKLTDALVSLDKEGAKSKGRSGQNCWIKHDHDEITLQVAKSISDLIMVPLTHAEQFQIVHYNVSQEYKK